MSFSRVLGILAAVLPAASAAQVTPGQLDDAPLRPPEFLSASALGDDVLVTWNSMGPQPFSLYWTILDADGGMKNRADAGALGEFSFSPPHAAAAPDAGLWLVAYPDKSGGGTTGGARLEKSAPSASTPAWRHSTQRRCDWTSARWRPRASAPTATPSWRCGCASSSTSRNCASSRCRSPDAGPGDARHYGAGFGCSGAPGAVPLLGALVMAALRRRRTRG